VLSSRRRCVHVLVDHGKTPGRWMRRSMLFWSACTSSVIRLRRYVSGGNCSATVGRKSTGGGVRIVLVTRCERYPTSGAAHCTLWHTQGLNLLRKTPGPQALALMRATTTARTRHRSDRQIPCIAVRYRACTADDPWFSPSFKIPTRQPSPGELVRSLRKDHER
jgi:hypothetical protein